jgi:hypothetical protein
MYVVGQFFIRENVLKTISAQCPRRYLSIVKADMLSLRMMALLKDCLTLVPKHYGEQLDLAQLPEDEEVYRTLQRADTIGMFQVESRAQKSSLPRNRPEKFYDLVVQVAIIRPGPIVGKMMHPYMRRRQKQEEVTYPHPSLESTLKRTLGVPLFQEQLLRMAMVVANFTGSEAEAVIAEAEVVAALRVNLGSPIFLIERTSYSTDGRPVDYEKLYYRGDLVRFVTRLARKGSR